MNLGKDAFAKISMTKEQKARFQTNARSRGMHLGNWLLQAALSYAKNNENFNKKQNISQLWPSGWPKTSKCELCLGRDHDPKDCRLAPADFSPTMSLAEDLK